MNLVVIRRLILAITIVFLSIILLLVLIGKIH